MSTIQKVAGQLEGILFDLEKARLAMPLGEMIDAQEAVAHLRKAHTALLRVERNRRLSAQTPKPSPEAPKT